MPEDSLIRKIRDIEKKFRILFDNPDDVVWVFDLLDQKLVYVSGEIEKILGYPPEEAQELSPAQICTPKCLKAAMATLKSEMAKVKQGTHKTIRLSLEFVAKDGRKIVADVDWRLHDDHGRIKAIGLLRDPNRKKAVLRMEKDISAQLQEVLQERERLRWEVKILQGLLPICAQCKKIRDEDGTWHSLEEYVESHSESEFTHTICPPCRKRLYPELS